MSVDLRSQAAIAGVGLYGLGEAPGQSHLEIMARAVKIALDDAGVSLAEVDGLFTSNMNNLLAGVTVGEYLGVVPRVTDATNFGGSAFVAFLQSASMAIASGLCEVALICYGSNQRTASGKLQSPVEPQPYEAPYQPRNPVGAYALAAARHMYEYGTTRRDLAEVAVSMRAWATLNPDAFLRDPLDVEMVLASRMVADPLSVRDCCLVTDGGGAVVLVSAQRARSLRTPPIHVRGVGVAHTHKSIMEMPDLTTTPAVLSSALAYDMAGVRPADIDLVELYDAFTINPILFMEDLGFCKKGEGGAFFTEGHGRPGGRLPVNTNGGGLSCTHPGMYGIFAIIEAVQQLRGEAGARQVRDRTIALVHGNGGTLASQATGILSPEP